MRSTINRPVIGCHPLFPVHAPRRVARNSIQGGLKKQLTFSLHFDKVIEQLMHVLVVRNVSVGAFQSLSLISTT
jgi:hypothetical protein